MIQIEATTYNVNRDTNTNKQIQCIDYKCTLGLYVRSHQRWN